MKRPGWTFLHPTDSSRSQITNNYPHAVCRLPSPIDRYRYPDLKIERKFIFRVLPRFFSINTSRLVTKKEDLVGIEQLVDLVMDGGALKCGQCAKGL